MELLLLRLLGRKVHRDRDDKILWTKSKHGVFSTLYKVLEPSRQGVIPSRAT